MYLARTFAASLLLLSVPACTVIEKNLLDTGLDPGDGTTTSDGGSAGSTGAPTTGTSSGPDTTTDITTDTTEGPQTGTTGPVEEPPFLVHFGTDLLCMPYCVDDVDPRTIVVEPDCQLYEVDVPNTNGEFTPILRCVQVGASWEIPAGAVRCFEELIDPSGLTPAALDDMSEPCIDHGSNLEFIVVMNEPLPPGRVLAASCELSAEPELDCPGL
jgi:hypothetical protein